MFPSIDLVWLPAVLSDPGHRLFRLTWLMWAPFGRPVGCWSPSEAPGISR